jgi:hypothetical protein
MDDYRYVILLTFGVYDFNFARNHELTYMRPI